MMKISLLRTVGLAMLVSQGLVFAVDYDIAATGVWSAPATWTPNTSIAGPTTTDTITIDSLPGNRTVTIDVAPTILGLTFNDTFNATFTPSGNRTVTINGSLIKSNSGSMFFRSTSGNLLTMSITGSLAVNNSFLALGQAGDNNTATSVTVLGQVSVASGATLGVRATTQTYGETTLDGSMVLYGNNNATATFAGLSGSGVLSGTSTSGTNIRTIQFNKASGTSTFSGNVTESAASSLTKVTKQNNYTQVFSGSSNYTGQTLISAGTLLVSGTHRDGATASVASVNTGYNTTTTGHYQVESGATLGGSGLIGGNSSVANSNMVYVKNGGVLSPGAGLGALTLDGEFITGSGAKILSMASGADFSFELAGNGGAPDQINLWNYEAGRFTLNGNEVNLSLSGAQVAGTYTVSLFQFFEDSGLTPGGNDITTGLIVGTLGSGISVEANPFTYDGDSINLTYTVIPEPGAAGLLLMGLGALAWVRRSRCKAA